MKNAENSSDFAFLVKTGGSNRRLDEKRGKWSSILALQLDLLQPKVAGGGSALYPFVYGQNGAKLNSYRGRMHQDWGIRSEALVSW